jgi:pyruvate dehydrogenase E2 component (dihydrolipoamide acetyltransferase)
MSVEFRMPDIGEGIAEVELIEWHVSVGSQVREYEVVATIQTDKSIVEVPSPVTGTVTRLGAKEGDMLPVGDVLVVFDTAGGGAAERATDQGTTSAADSAAGTGGGAGTVSAAGLAAASAGPGGTRQAESVSMRPKATPAVRRLATELGVDLGSVRGTGPGGRIIREDVMGAAAACAEAADGTARSVQATTRMTGSGGLAAGVSTAVAAPKDAADEHVPVRGLRRQIARKMIESWRSVPHITDWREADARQLIEARRELIAHLPALGSALTYVPFLVKITATALRQHPLMNASFHEDADEYVLHRQINIGVATATADGLLVPVVKNADRKSIPELATEIAGLVAVTRERKATLEQLSGGTYTVNNIGAIGGHMGTPIIRTPEVGILAFGRIADRVVAVDGSAVVRPTIMLSSVGDHRLHDGDTLGAFTSAVMELVEHPLALLGELR